MTALREALDHLHHARFEEALDALLEAWRKTKRHPAIADAIDLLSATLTETEKPIRAVGGKSAKAAWEEAAASKRAAMMGRMLEAIADSSDRYRQLDALIAMPSDPRMAMAAKRWFEEPPVRATSRAPFFGAVVSLVDRTDDLRLAQFFMAITQPDHRAIAIRLYGQQTWAPLVALADKLAKKRVPALDVDDTQTLAAIAKLVRAPAPKAPAGTTASEEELYDNIYADPHDLEPRAVLADLLQQRGEPRGELIAMQLLRDGTDKGPSTAEKKLLQQWGRTWLGPLEPALHKTGLVYERGFVARAKYVGGDKAIGAREWSTLTHLDVSLASQRIEGSHALFSSEPARNLRHVVGIDPALDFPQLRDKERPMPWVTVGWLTRYWHHASALQDGPGKLFPDARKLLLRATDDDTFHVNSDELLALLEKWPAIDDFEVDAVPDLVFGIRSHTRGKQLRRLVLDGPMGVLTIEDDRLDFETRFCTNDVSTLLADMVMRLGFTHVTLRGEKKPAVKGDYFFQEYMRMSLVPLREATERAGIGLTVEGE